MRWKMAREWCPRRAAAVPVTVRGAGARSARRARPPGADAASVRRSRPVPWRTTARHRARRGRRTATASGQAERWARSGAAPTVPATSVLMPAMCTNGPRASAANTARHPEPAPALRPPSCPVPRHDQHGEDHQRQGRRQFREAVHALRSTSALPSLPNHGELGLGMTNASRSTPGGLAPPIDVWPGHLSGGEASAIRDEHRRQQHGCRQRHDQREARVRGPEG